MKHTKKKLKNGLRLITVPMKSNQTATVMVLVEAGSKYETPKNNGISHFLEHMCFKGTEKRSVFEITEELDGLGAESNAFTSEEFTGYYAKAHYKNVDGLVDVVSDIYLNSTLPLDELEKERGVVIEEINMYEDMPHRKIWDIFEELLYGDQPAGVTVLGPKSNIRSLTRRDFISYRKKHYVPSATTVVIAGNIDEKKVHKLVNKAFGVTLDTKKYTKKKTKDIQKSPAVHAHYKKTDQAHMILGVRAFDRYDERGYTLRVIAAILGQGMSSRLFKILREERGMCYYVRAVPMLQTDTGYFAIGTGVGKKRVEEAATVIMDEFRRLRDEKVLSKELAKAKEYIIGIKALSVESSDEVAEWFGFQELYHDDIKDLQAFNKKIKAVTADDVQKLAQELFVDERLNFAVIGPSKGTKSLEKIVRM